MPRVLTDRENVAATVLYLIMQTATSLKCERVHLLEIAKRIEYHERKMVLEWIDSAIACGIANMYGEEIAVSPKGQVFLAFTMQVANSVETVDEDARTHPGYPPVLAAIAAESRFRPPPSSVAPPQPVGQPPTGNSIASREKPLDYRRHARSGIDSVDLSTRSICFSSSLTE